MPLKMKQQIKKNKTGTKIATKANKQTTTKKAPPHTNMLGTRGPSSYLNRVLWFPFLYVKCAFAYKHFNEVL